MVRLVRWLVNLILPTRLFHDDETRWAAYLNHPSVIAYAQRVVHGE